MATTHHGVMYKASDRGSIEHKGDIEHIQNIYQTVLFCNLSFFDFYIAFCHFFG